MPATLREQILFNILGLDTVTGLAVSPATGLRSITTANGFNQDVRRVYYPPLGPTELRENPSINVVIRGETNRPRIQLANEKTLTIEFQCFTQEYIASQKTQEIERLLKDVEKLLLTDVTWGDLAIDTTVVNSGSSPFEVAAPIVIMSVTAEMLFRERRGDPFVQQVI